MYKSGQGFSTSALWTLLVAVLDIEGMEEGHQNTPLLRTSHVENETANVS